MEALLSSVEAARADCRLRERKKLSALPNIEVRFKYMVWYSVSRDDDPARLDVAPPAPPQRLDPRGDLAARRRPFAPAPAAPADAHAERTPRVAAVRVEFGSKL